MLDWILDIYNKILEVVNQIGTTLDDLIMLLDDVQFSSDVIITKWLATIHYIVGTPLYLMLTTLILIGAGFILWKLVKIVINAISSVIPGLKGKVKVE